LAPLTAHTWTYFTELVTFDKQVIVCGTLPQTPACVDFYIINTSAKREQLIHSYLHLKDGVFVPIL